MNAKIKSFLPLIVGCLLSQPFIWVQTLSSQHPYMSPIELISTILMIFGLPIFMYGVGLLVRSPLRGSSSTAELDLARIRFSVENDKLNK